MPTPDLLRGAIDTHIHAGPSHIPRSVDLVEAAREAEAAGMAGIVVKDHHVSTVTPAALVQKYHVARKDFHVFGSITLNNHAGGLNPKVLEVALLMGVRMVWLPTVSSQNHVDKLHGGGVSFPRTGQAEREPETYFRLIDEDGQLKPEVDRLLDMLAQHPHVVLATGHGTAAEADAVIRAARQKGIQRIVATHPAYMVDASIEQMKDWAARGALIELCATTCYSRSRLYTVTVQRTVDIIRALGPEAIILSSDFGQVDNPRPVPGMQAWFEELMGAGITPGELQVMFRDNSRRLMGIDQ